LAILQQRRPAIQNFSGRLNPEIESQRIELASLILDQGCPFLYVPGSSNLRWPSRNALTVLPERTLPSMKNSAERKISVTYPSLGARPLNEARVVPNEWVGRRCARLPPALR